MGAVDIIIVIFLAVGAIRGYKKGFLMELIAILALILGILGGLKLLQVGMTILSDNFQISGALLPYLTFLIIFVAIILLVNVIGRLVKKMIDLTLLGSMDDIAGAILGLLKWAFALSVLIWITSSFNLFIPDSYQESSRLFTVVASIAPTAVGVLTEVFPFIEDLFELIRETLQSQIT